MFKAVMRVWWEPKSQAGSGAPFKILMAKVFALRLRFHSVFLLVMLRAIMLHCVAVTRVITQSVFHENVTVPRMRPQIQIVSVPLHPQMISQRCNCHQTRRKKVLQKESYHDLYNAISKDVWFGAGNPRGIAWLCHSLGGLAHASERLVQKLP
jgi:hypothetical protein